MPQISVIVPVYNTATYLEQCLNSLCRQTMREIEIICVNDGSTDQSAEILEKFAKKYPFIRVFSQTNQGQAAARNKGVREAKAPYISFVDSDDWVEPDFLEHLYRLIITYNADLAQCRLLKYKDGVKRQTPVKVITNPLGKVRAQYSVCTKLCKKTLISDLPFIEGIYYEDYPWVICLLMRVSKMAFSEDKLYHYRFNPNSTTKSVFTPKKVQDFWTGLKAVRAYFDAHNLAPFYLQKHLVPNILKSQLKLIEESKEKTPLLKVFAQEIRWAKENKLLSIWHNSWLRLIKYHQILRRYGNF